MPTGRGEMPLVSVGFPVFNEEKGLPAALDSILAQDYEHLELIVCDNASTDATLEIAREYAAHDARVAVHEGDVNRGASFNFNRCFELASGPYFTWASGHDTRLPQAIRKCVEALEGDPALVLCYPRTVVRRFDGTSEIPDDALDTRGLRPHLRLQATVEQLVWANIVHGVIRSSALRRTRLSRRCLGADLVLMAELSVLGEFHQLDDTLYVRTENRAPEASDGWRERNLDLIGVDGGLARSRPYTAMGLETVAGVWHVSNPRAKVVNAARASVWFRDLWHGHLNDESALWRVIDTAVEETRLFRARVKRLVRRLLA